MTNNANSALLKAAKHGDLIALREAIGSGEDLHGTDLQGWTPLVHVAVRGWAEGMKMLIEAGADVNHGIEVGFTALLLAVQSGHLGAVRLLLENGAKVHDAKRMKWFAGYLDGKKREQMIAVLERAMPDDAISS
jgi:ankyrin repeat protein